MPDEITALCRFYADQYGMIFHTVYDPVFLVLKGHIVFRNTRKNYSIMCAGLSDKEIAGHFHSIIYYVLAEEGRIETCRKHEADCEKCLKSWLNEYPF